MNIIKIYLDKINKKSKFTDDLIQLMINTDESN